MTPRNRPEISPPTTISGCKRLRKSFISGWSCVQKTFFWVFSHTFSGHFLLCLRCEKFLTRNRSENHRENTLEIAQKDSFSGGQGAEKRLRKHPRKCPERLIFWWETCRESAQKYSFSGGEGAQKTPRKRAPGIYCCAAGRAGDAISLALPHRAGAAGRCAARPARIDLPMHPSWTPTQRPSLNS